MKASDTTLCVVLDPPQELIDQCETHGVDPYILWQRLNQPRKLIGRLPVQLLAGIEFCDDPAVLQTELHHINQAFMPDA